jgi:putative thioredoxin
MIELGATPAPQPDLIRDGSEATFMADVIEASREVPVIVDFWATWCGPCRTLGPAIEQAVKDAKGKVRLVKIDVDKNQRISQQMRIQSIPAVYAFFDGKPIDGFVGAQTGSALKAFIDRVIAAGGNGGLDEALDAAEKMLAEGALADAFQTFAAVLQEDEGNLRALSGMMRAHLSLGETEQARGLLTLVPEGKGDDPLIAGVRAQLELAEAGAKLGGGEGLARKVEDNPGDHQARFDLATALAAAGDAEGAIDHLLELFRRDRNWNGEAAKTQLFKLFDSLGPKSAEAQSGRRRLASMIYA